MVGHEPAWTDHDPGHVLRCELDHDLEEIGAYPLDLRTTGALPSDLPSFESDLRCNGVGGGLQLIDIGVALRDDAGRKTVSGEYHHHVFPGVVGQTVE